MEGKRILVPGRTCWRLDRAGRVAFLVDGADYFATFAAAAERARRSIQVLAWDVHSRVPLRAEDPGCDLGSFLKRLVERVPELEIRILTWDFVRLYAADREPREETEARLGGAAHPRMHLRFDAAHPPLACHHQKVAVIDDRLAFVGGLDFTAGRWDTPEHRPDEPRRLDAKGAIGPPFHDVVMTVDGDVARSLGELARERWLRATGEALEPPGEVESDPWPAELAVELRDVEVGISRTEPAYAERPEIREVEAANRAAIEAARRWIYAENQYFTAEEAGARLGSRLAEPAAPEVVLVGPRDPTDWLEKSTMGVLRGRLLRRLRRRDRSGRFRAYHPVVPGLDESYVKVHSKVVIVDERFLRIGSSNFCNRSLGLDTECDLAIESRGDAEIERVIASVRSRLLAEHLGVSPGEVERALAEEESLVGAIERLRGRPRTLEELEGDVEPWLDGLVPHAPILDPLRPFRPGGWLRSLLTGTGGAVRASVVPGIFVFGLAIAMAAAWKWTPLSEWLTHRNLAATARAVRASEWAPAIVLAAFVVGTVLMLPVNLVVLATAIAFSPFWSFVYSLSGCLLAGAVTYGIGVALGREALGFLGKERVERIGRDLESHGILALATLRLVPVAPFGIVNLLAGAWRVPFWDYTLGTAIGMAPGILAITLLRVQVERTIRNPGIGSVGVLAAVTIALTAGSLWLSRWRREPGR